MNHMTYAHVRQHLAEVMDTVCKSRAPVVVTRRGAGSVVLLPLEEFRAMEETLHLLRRPRNADRLLQSIADAGAGRLEEHEVAEPRRSHPQGRGTA